MNLYPYAMDRYLMRAALSLPGAQLRRSGGPDARGCYAPPLRGAVAVMPRADRRCATALAASWGRGGWADLADFARWPEFRRMVRWIQRRPAWRVHLDRVWILEAPRGLTTGQRRTVFTDITAATGVSAVALSGGSIFDAVRTLRLPTHVRFDRMPLLFHAQPGDARVFVPPWCAPLVGAAVTGAPWKLAPWTPTRFDAARRRTDPATRRGLLDVLRALGHDTWEEALGALVPPDALAVDPDMAPPDASPCRRVGGLYCGP